MRSEEVLKLYKNGERNFSGFDLRGESFQGENLSGANFTGAKIQGANFKLASLKNTKFTSSEAGIDKYSRNLLVFSSFFAAYIWGYLTSFSGISIVSLLWNEGNKPAFLIGVVTISLAVIPALSSLLAKLTSSKKMTLQKFIARSMAILGLGISVLTVLFSIIDEGSLSISLVIAGFFSGILCQFLATGVSITRSIIAVIIEKHSFFSSLSTLMCLVGALMASLNFQSSSNFMSIFLPTLLLAFSSVAIGDYASRGAVSGDPLWSATLRIAVSLISTRATSFYKSDLTRADFSYASLQGVDFRFSNIHLVRWLGANYLEYTRTGNSYLSDQRIQKLVIENCGESQVLSELNLEGVNLENADLQGVDLSRSNLNMSSLKNSDLRRSILKQTQLDQCDLSCSNLTGACIEEWGITPETKLNNVRCEYIFMQLADPQKGGNPRRKPENWDKIFEEGEFSDFIKPLIQTLDLYHNQAVDPRILSLAFNELRENHQEAELEIISMERRGKDRDKFLLRVETTKKANHSQLHKEYFERYEQLSTLPSSYLSILIQEKEGQIQTLKAILDTAMNRATIQAGTYFKQGDTMSEEKGNIRIENFKGKMSGFAVAGENQEIRESAIGEISGDVEIAISNLTDSTSSEKPSLKSLLIQLKKSVEEEQILSPEDKADLLEQIKALAEAKGSPDENKKASVARKAKKIFDATIATLPDTAKVVDTCRRLLPLILKYLGI